MYPTTFDSMKWNWGDGTGIKVGGGLYDMFGMIELNSIVSASFIKRSNIETATSLHAPMKLSFTSHSLGYFLPYPFALPPPSTGGNGGDDLPLKTTAMVLYQQRQQWIPRWVLSADDPSLSWLHLDPSFTLFIRPCWPL